MWISITILVAILLLYALWGRAWLKTQPWAETFFAWIEPVEIALYKKSETLLVGRMLSVGGVLVTFYDTAAVSFSSLDLTPVTSRVLSTVPEDMRGLVVSATFAGIGLLISWLRKRTTKPIELIAVPDKEALQGPAADALAVADQAKIEAVAAVAEAKAA